LLLEDLRNGKAIFKGDDPERFARWFRGAIHKIVVDAIEFCVPQSAESRSTPATDDIADRKAADPADVALRRELAQLAGEEIEQLRETDHYEVVRDYLDGRSSRDSGVRLGISKSEVCRMLKRVFEQLAAKFGG
jgi:DNA-directed RNA polymerase specialized sigma24 family protein